MNTIRKITRRLGKRSLWKQLWRDISALVSRPGAPAASPPRPAELPLVAAAVAPPSPACAAETRAAPSQRKRTSRRRRLAAPTSPPPEKLLAEGKRILIIDDDATFLELLARLLRGFDCVVETALGPIEGMAAAHRRRPDVLVIDFNMPEANGFEVIERLRKDDELAAVPRIMMTGAARVGELRELLRWDVVGVLSKPVSRTDLVAAIGRALGGRLPEGSATMDQANQPQPLAVPEEPKPAPKLPQEETADSLEIRFTGGRFQSADSQANPAAEALEAPAVKAVSDVMRQALLRSASDIHIEPMAAGLQVRLRVDGELLTAMTYPLAMARAVAARVKVMSNLDIAERRMPQDGRVAIEAGSKRIDFRVSTLPSLFGEKIVMRVIGTTRVDGDLSKLGLAPERLEALRWALAQPNGLILLTGPTGSGKTTSLYRMLAYLNNGKRNIVTVEDPVEGELDGITQVAVNAEIGLTFEKALRAFLRQDPDVMLVGEIRDAETAEIAARAALTGRLILSTLHTNDSVSSISRLVGMKVPAYMIAGAVRLVVAQRLVRLLCRKCRREEEPTPVEREALAAAGQSFERLWRPAGCGECGMQGYSGRAPVLELLALRSLEIREMVREQAPAEKVRAQAVAEGMVPLPIAALELVRDGRTSFAEALRAASLD